MTLARDMHVMSCNVRTIVQGCGYKHYQWNAALKHFTSFQFVVWCNILRDTLTELAFAELVGQKSDSTFGDVDRMWRHARRVATNVKEKRHCRTTLQDMGTVLVCKDKAGGGCAGQPPPPLPPPSTPPPPPLKRSPAQVPNFLTSGPLPPSVRGLTMSQPAARVRRMYWGLRGGVASGHSPFRLQGGGGGAAKGLLTWFLVPNRETGHGLHSCFVVAEIWADWEYLWGGGGDVLDPWTLRGGWDPLHLATYPPLDTLQQAPCGTPLSARVYLCITHTNQDGTEHRNSSLFHPNIANLHTPNYPPPPPILLYWERLRVEHATACMRGSSTCKQRDNCPTLTHQKYVPHRLWTSNVDNVFLQPKLVRTPRPTGTSEWQPPPPLRNR